MNYWLFSDFDGTLKNGKNNDIDPKDYDWITNFQKEGNKVGIATGRDWKNVSKSLNEIFNFSPDYYIANTGGVVVDKNGKILYKKFMGKEEQKLILDFFKNIEKDIVAFKYAFLDKEDFLFINKKYKESESILKIPGNENIKNKSIEELYNKDLICVKMVVSKKIWNDLLKYVKKNNIKVETVSNNVGEVIFCEIHGHNVTKANGIKELAKSLGINEDKIIVAGDDENDVSMLRAFNNSFIVKQPYNKKIRKFANKEINNIFEIQEYI